MSSKKRASRKRGQDEWDLRSNLNQSANSQGTLFRGGKPVDAHRYPRGFTPKRQQQVRNLLAGMDVSGPHDVAFANKGKSVTTFDKFPRLVQDTISRSKIPLSNLNGLTGISPLPDWVAGEGTWAQYHPKTRNVLLRFPDEAADAAPQSSDSEVRARVEQSLVHELGHHVDRMTDITKRIQQNPASPLGTSSRYPNFGRTAYAFGEGIADEFMVNNYVPDRRDPYYDPEEHTYRGRGAVTPEASDPYERGRAQARTSLEFPEPASRKQEFDSSHQLSLW